LLLTLRPDPDSPNGGVNPSQGCDRLIQQPCRSALQSCRHGVLGPFLDPEDGEDLRQHVQRSLLDLLGIETADRVRDRP
jgi:hypothetical protein